MGRRMSKKCRTETFVESGKPAGTFHPLLRIFFMSHSCISVGIEHKEELRFLVSPYS